VDIVAGDGLVAATPLFAGRCFPATVAAPTQQAKTNMTNSTRLLSPIDIALLPFKGKIS
jgi:hypothetical protein